MPNPRGTAKLAILQDAWAECAGNWKSSQLFKKITNRSTVTSHGARVWLTRAQIAKKYDSNEIANEICDAKLNDAELKESHTKMHPDAPTNEARVLQYAFQM